MPLARLWYLAAFAGALGAAIVFDTIPGINWAIWVGYVVAGLVAARRPDRDTLRAMRIPLAFAVVLAAGATVTTTPLLLLGIAAITASLLALSVTIARDPADANGYGAVDIIAAPVRALQGTLRGACDMIVESSERIEATRASPAVRGVLIALPIVIVFALLFASADPLLARGRDVVLGALTSWESLPRVVFGVLLGLFVLGAYAASRAGVTRDNPVSGRGAPRVGSTEWRIVIGAVAAVSWLFVLLQISYLFRAAPSAAGSGVTYAEYARRGFAELSVASTIGALLIVAAHRRASTSERTKTTRLATPSIALLAAVMCVLASAFHRVTLYEGAYGYTTTRLYAQAYMLLVCAILVAIAWHATRDFDERALAREVMTLSLIALTALVYWNGEAWVARANLDRFAQTGKVDIPYLARGLSPDAYPTLASALPAMRAPERAQLGAALAAEYSRRPYLRNGSSWYEWNLRRGHARGALLRLVPSATGVAPF